MGRLTQRNGNTVLYVGNRCKYPGIDQAGTMKVAAMRECMERLADYEDTGLTPEELREVKQAMAEMMPQILERIVVLAPQMVDAIRTAMERMTPEQITKLLQEHLQKN